MKSKEMTFEKLEPVKTSFDGLIAVLEQIVTIAFAFALAHTVALGSISPLGIAFVAASKKRFIPAAVLGASLGYIFSLDSGIMPLRYIATIIAVAVVVYTLSKLDFYSSGKVAVPLIAFCCCIATGLTVLFAGGFDFSQLLLYIAEAVIAGGVTYFFRLCFYTTSFKKGIYAVNSHELTGLIVCGSLLLMSFASFTLGGISIARIISVFVILVCALFAREAGGSIIGITLGLVMGLSCQSEYVVIGYSFGGLLAGIFAPLGVIGVSIAFIIANVISIAIQGFNAESSKILVEALIGSLIFVFIPSKLMDKIRLFFSSSCLMPSLDGIRRSLIMRLDVASNAMDELSDTVDRVSNVLTKSGTNANDLYAIVTEKICMSCGNCSFCLEHKLNDTMNAFNDIYSTLRSGESVTADNVPKHFAKRCICLTSLLESFNSDYSTFNAKATANARVSQMRSIVASQFDSMTLLLKDLSKEFDEEKTFDTETSAKIKSLLDSFGITAFTVSCILDRFGRMRIEIHCSEIKEKVDRFELTNAMNELCCKEFEAPSVMVINNETIINFCEHSPLHIKVGASQHTYDDSQYCGDYYECFNDGRGRQIMIISDGMGTGGRAAIDGAMAAGLLAKLIKTGFGFECALKIVNSALMIKSSDETLATLDVACIDLFSGKADFYKAGAAATLVKHGKKISKLERSSLPIGILKEVEFAHSTATLNKGDIVLMTSDGVWVGDEKWISKELSDYKGDNANELAQSIVNDAAYNCNDSNGDDITVLVAMIEK